MIKAVSLEKPVDYVVLFVQRDPDGWRFEGWKAALGHEIPEAPPATTLGLAFHTPEAAANYFTKILIAPESAPKPVKHVVLGLMSPAPKCDYYWPPSLNHCIKNFEADLRASSEAQIPIKRVLILGAGFSAAFEFSTSATIVRGVMEFFKQWQPSDWFHQQYETVREWLDIHFPNWHSESPYLYDFLDTFFPLAVRRSQLHRFRLGEWLSRLISIIAGKRNVCMDDPLFLFEQRVSWERDNCDHWIQAFWQLPDEDTYYVLRSFESLLATYLILGKTKDDVEQPWALKLFRQLEVSDAILTFNWDVIPEALLMEVDKPFCRYDWTRERTKLVKLHGSVDLLGAPNGLMLGDLAREPTRFECITEKLWRARTSDDVLVHAGTFGRAIFPPERYNKASVLIMPPRYPLGYGYELIQFNWRKARAALERAREVYVIGYSIPEEDKPFRALAKSVIRRWGPEVTVDVWNPNSTVGDRAKQLFGKRRVTCHSDKAATFRFR